MIFISQQTLESNQRRGHGRDMWHVCTTEIHNVVLVGKPEGKKPLGRLRHRWRHSIQMYLKQTGREGWIHLSQDRAKWRSVVNMAVSCQFPQNAGNFLTSKETVNFPRRALLPVSELMRWDRDY
jgi:hypothetical protein